MSATVRIREIIEDILRKLDSGEYEVEDGKYIRQALTCNGEYTDQELVTLMFVCKKRGETYGKTQTT